MASPSPTDQGIVPIEAMQPVAQGWTVDAVRAHLGSPLAIQSPKDDVGPTATFKSLGFTIFDFAADRDLDAVWVYKHDRRGKFRLKQLVLTYLGIRDGIVTGLWREQHDCAP